MVSLLQRVEDVLTSYDEPSIALDALRATASITSLLSFIRADAATLAELAGHSYRHRNGFDKIILAAPGRGPLKLVLHVWPREGRATSDNIHDHRWSFSSIVVCGALLLEFYEHDSAGQDYAVMRYRPLPGAGSFELDAQGSTSVSVRSTVTMTVGNTYRWACDRLHRAWGLPGQVTATLIVQGAPTRPSTTVLVSNEDVQRLAGPQHLHRLSAKEVDRTLAELVTDSVQAAWCPDQRQFAGRSS